MRALSRFPHPDQLINRIQDGILGVLNPLLKLLVLPDEGWTDAGLVSPWVAYGLGWAGPAYRRGPDGCVRLRGRVAGGTSPGTLSTVLTLPPGYRPRYRCTLALVPSAWNGAQQASRVDVFSTGEVKIQAFDLSTDPSATTPCDWLSLDGVAFLAEQ